MEVVDKKNTKKYRVKDSLSCDVNGIKFDPTVSLHLKGRVCWSVQRCCSLAELSLSSRCQAMQSHNSTHLYEFIKPMISHDMHLLFHVMFHILPYVYFSKA